MIRTLMLKNRLTMNKPAEPFIMTDKNGLNVLMSGSKTLIDGKILLLYAHAVLGRTHLASKLTSDTAVIIEISY